MCENTRFLFCNDVCLAANDVTLLMMTASPNDVAYANYLRQTSHHIVYNTSLGRRPNIISSVSEIHHLQTINLMLN
ncbi:MAG: hypothetical protein IKL46_01920 [Clostridia bacterium]|nr:hypothetical protein [Clostridia bacterium]